MGVRRPRSRLDSGGRRARPPTVALAAVSLVAGLGLAACGSGSGSGANELNWYINPDNGSQAKLAEKCTKASNGAYKIVTSVLPNSASDQREQLLRRLAANDSSMDLMSLDPVFVAEFAQADFLQPIDRPRIRELLDGDAVCQTRHGIELTCQPPWAHQPAVECAFHQFHEGLTRREPLDADARLPARVARRNQRVDRFE